MFCRVQDMYDVEIIAGICTIEAPTTLYTRPGHPSPSYAMPFSPGILMIVEQPSWREKVLDLSTHCGTK